MTDQRLPAACFHVLLALADRPRHGLGIMDEVEARTEGRVQLGPGSLYGSIKRLVRDGHVCETEPPDSAAPADPRRRYYTLTGPGRDALQKELQTLRMIMEAAEAKDLMGRGA